MKARRPYFKKQQHVLKNRTNDQIRVLEVRLINEAGEQIGIIETTNALKMAKEAGLDLVEISPNAKPPVCKIIDWGKYQYQQAKKEQLSKNKQKKISMKGIRIRPSTGDNDLNFKAQQASKFLEKGNKVKIEIVLKGREKAFMSQSREILLNFIDKIEFPAKIEQSVRRQFNGLNIIVVPIEPK